MSVAPTLAAVCAPLWDRLAAAAQVVAGLARQVVVALNPLWEPLMYLGCLYFIGEPSAGFQPVALIHRFE